MIKEIIFYSIVKTYCKSGLEKFVDILYTQRANNTCSRHRPLFSASANVCIAMSRFLLMNSMRERLLISHNRPRPSWLTCYSYEEDQKIATTRECTLVTHPRTDRIRIRNARRGIFFAALEKSLLC